MSADNSFEKLDFTQSLSNRDNRRAYLITYSQADMEKVPNTQRFSEIILEAFHNGASNRCVEQWACCIEDHANGGKHFHMCVKFNGTRRWNPIKNSVWNKHHLVLHFSSQHCGYVAAYRYVAKNKPVADILHSPNHTDLSTIGSPKTKKAMRRNSTVAKRQRLNTTSDRDSTPAAAEAPVAKKRLSNSDVSEFMVKHNIRKDSELLQAALLRNQSGEKDLHSFVLNKSPKALADLIATTWRMQEAPQIIERENKSRLEIIQSHAFAPCNSNCKGEWLVSARDVLLKNHINAIVFATALRESFNKGRQKRNNILLVGPTNCGKSFLLNPIEIMFTAFVNPATGRYAWVGLDECEVAYLNDFRLSSEIIAWSDFLLLLEGQTVHLPRPKNQYATDLCIDRTNSIPFFATSKAQIEYIGKYNQRDEKETDMMSSRWTMFSFSHQIPAKEMKQLEPCSSCFAKLVLLGSEYDSNSF